MDAKQVWRAALGELQVSLSPANYETWVRDTQLIDVDDQKFKIAVPNGFAKDWLETRYRSLISQTLARIVGYSVQVEFVVGVTPEATPAEATERSEAEASPRVGTTAQVRLEPTRVGGEGGTSNINPRYTFNNFIVAVVLALADAVTAIILLRLLVISFYFHSALTKLDYSFLHTLGQQFLTALVGIFGASLDGWSESARLLAAGALPGAELLIALGLCWRPTRGVALVAAVLLHAVLLVILGPWGLDHKPGVLVWNVYFIVQDVLLFWLSAVPSRGDPADMVATGKSPSSRPLSALIGAVVLLPFLAPTTWFDMWPSWGLYASCAERVQLLIHRREAEQLPGELQPFLEPTPGDEDSWLVVRLDRWSLESLWAPVYPQNRYQLGVAEAVIARYGLLHRVRVFRFDLADRFTGEREYTRFNGLAEVIGSAGEYYLNSRPRQNLLPAPGD